MAFVSGPRQGRQDHHVPASRGRVLQLGQPRRPGAGARRTGPPRGQARRRPAVRNATGGALRRVAQTRFNPPRYLRTQTQLPRSADADHTTRCQDENGSPNQPPTHLSGAGRLRLRRQRSCCANGRSGPAGLRAALPGPMRHPYVRLLAAGDRCRNGDAATTSGSDRPFPTTTAPTTTEPANRATASQSIPDQTVRSATMRSSTWGDFTPDAAR